jgi:hypothetical protein
MDIVFLISEQRTGQSGDSMPGDHMSSVTKPIKRPMIESASAANADRLDEMTTSTTVETKGIEGTGSWDAYDVWRRFIKEARERRKGQATN